MRQGSRNERENKEKFRLDYQLYYYNVYDFLKILNLRGKIEDNNISNLRYQQDIISWGIRYISINLSFSTRGNKKK